jgi:hypothetical protein
MTSNNHLDSLNYELSVEPYLNYRKKTGFMTLSKISVKLMHAVAAVRSGAGSIFLRKEDMHLLQSKGVFVDERLSKSPTTTELPARTKPVKKYG